MLDILKYPLLDKQYIYNYIITKQNNNEELKWYHKFYLWSYHNRKKILLICLFILLLILLNLFTKQDDFYTGGNLITRGMGNAWGFGKKYIAKPIITPLDYATKPVQIPLKFAAYKTWDKAKQAGTFLKEGAISAKETPGRIRRKFKELRREKRLKRGLYTSSDLKQFKEQREKATDPEEIAKLDALIKKAESSDNKFYTSVLPGYDISNYIFKPIFNFIIKKRIMLILFLIMSIYAFGVVVTPLILIFFIIKYSIRIYKSNLKHFKN